MAVYLGNKVVNIMMNGVDGIFKTVDSVDRVQYVSLGDSIAVGHSINADWEEDYGYHSQYGENGNTSTVIVPNSYANLTENNMRDIHKGKVVSATSFAHSGDENEDLRDKLEHEEVQKAIKKAEVVTICIGANTVLSPATKEIPNFIAYGNPALLQLDSALESGFALLESDASVYGSYRNIMTKLKELNSNPNTKFVFTTVYNPYKYLWLDECTDDNDYEDGYFAPIFALAPNYEVDIPFVGQMDVRKFLYESAHMPEITDRINDPVGDGSYSLGEWVEGKLARLNGILKQAVAEFGDSRFMVADTKAVFDSYPDRWMREDDNYSDLVNVEIVKGQTIKDLDWGQFWNNWSIDSLDKIVDSIANTIINEVILPDTDPHPEEDGQYALYRSFADVLGWEALTHYTITYNANGGTGSMANQEVVSIAHNRYGKSITAYAPLGNSTFSHPTEGYRFVGWNTKADGSGTSYSEGQSISITSDITLYAQWSNIYTLSVDSVPNSKSVTQSGSDTGIQDDYYQLWIAGSRQPSCGAFSNPPRVMTYPYGTPVGVIVKTVCGSNDLPSIRVNGTKISNTWDDYNKGHAYQFTLEKDTRIEFEWCDWGCVPNPLYPTVGDRYTGADAYWDCYIKTN